MLVLHKGAALLLFVFRFAVTDGLQRATVFTLFVSTAGRTACDRVCLQLWRRSPGGAQSGVPRDWSSAPGIAPVPASARIWPAATGLARVRPLLDRAAALRRPPRHGDPAFAALRRSELSGRPLGDAAFQEPNAPPQSGGIKARTGFE